MGVIGKLLSFARTTRDNAKQADIKIATSGDTLTAQYVQGAGDDAVPLPGDYPLCVRIERAGRIVVVGFVEPDATQAAQAGERRMYARDGDRAEVVQIWLKNDGTLLASNENGSYELRPDGSHKMISPGGSYELFADGKQRLENDNGSYELRANGSHRSQNASGYYELQAGGTVDVNTATIDPAGNIVATSVSAPSIKVNGKELKDHKHSGVTPGGGQTGPNV